MAEPAAAALPFVAERPESIDDILHAAAGAAVHWGLGEPTVVRIGINGVFACGDTVLRVSQPTAPADVSIELAHTLTARGVRVPQPARADAFDAGGGVWVTAWERIDHSPQREVDWRRVGEMIRVVHEIAPADLPHRHPLPWCTGFPWWHFDQQIETAPDLIDDASLAGIVECVSRNRWALDPDATSEAGVCHGDMHPGNVLVEPDGPVLIDWDLLCWGPRGWDHAPLLTWADRWDGSPGTYEAFADGYGADLRSESIAQALSQLRLVAATFGRARLAVTCPDAAAELEQRLRWWRGDPDAPRWTPQ